MIGACTHTSLNDVIVFAIVIFAIMFISSVAFIFMHLDGKSYDEK